MQQASEFGFGRICLLASILALLCSGTASAQLCGDLYEDGSIDIRDLTKLIEYLYIDTTHASISSIANMDGVIGVTHNDVAILTDRIFGTLTPLDCSVTSSVYPPCSDTVHFEYPIIPPGQTACTLSVWYTAHSSLFAMSFPFTWWATDESVVVDSIIGAPLCTVGRHPNRPYGFMVMGFAGDQVDGHEAGEYLLGRIAFSCDPSPYPIEVYIESSGYPYRDHLAVVSSYGHTKDRPIAGRRPVVYGHEMGPRPVVSCPSLVWPDAYVENYDYLQVSGSLANQGSQSADIHIETWEFSGPSLWLSVTPTDFTISPFAAPQDLHVTIGGVHAYAEYLEGEIRCYLDGETEPFDVIPVHVWAADSIEPPGVYDTTASGAWGEKGPGEIGLTVSNHGEIGHLGIGGVNLDFTASGTDCDPLAGVYLTSGSPFVMVGRYNYYELTTSHYAENVLEGLTWTPQPGMGIQGGTGSHAGRDYDSVFAGRMANQDSTIWMERTYYSPRSYPQNPSFVAVKTVVGTDVGVTDSVMIGEVDDWNVPSDAGAATSAQNNSGCTQPFEEQFVYFQGTDHESGACMPGTRRFATNTFLFGYADRDSCSVTQMFWSSIGIPKSSFLEIDTITGAYPADMWWDTAIYNGGAIGSPAESDQIEFLVYDILDELAPLSSRTYWTVYATGYDMDDYTELNVTVADARAWINAVSGYNSCLSCCEGMRGDVDQSGDPNTPTLSDLSAMIDHLFLSLAPLPCWEEGNLDGSVPEGPGSVTLSDLSALIDNLFITLGPLPPCP